MEFRLPANRLRDGALHIVKPKADIVPEFYVRQFAATCLFSHPPLRYAKLFGELPGGEQPRKPVALHAGIVIGQKPPKDSRFKLLQSRSAFRAFHKKIAQLLLVQRTRAVSGKPELASRPATTACH